MSALDKSSIIASLKALQKTLPVGTTSVSSFLSGDPLLLSDQAFLQAVSDCLIDFGTTASTQAVTSIKQEKNDFVIFRWQTRGSSDFVGLSRNLGPIGATSPGFSSETRRGVVLLCFSCAPSGLQGSSLFCRQD